MTLDDLIEYYVKNDIAFTTAIGLSDSSYMQYGDIPARDIRRADIYTEFVGQDIKLVEADIVIID